MANLNIKQMQSPQVANPLKNKVIKSQNKEIKAQESCSETYEK
jgi:uncharacterized protein (DUF305 family)